MDSTRSQTALFWKLGKDIYPIRGDDHCVFKLSWPANVYVTSQNSHLIMMQCKNGIPYLLLVVVVEWCWYRDGSAMVSCYLFVGPYTNIPFVICRNCCPFISQDSELWRSLRYYGFCKSEEGELQHSQPYTILWSDTWTWLTYCEGHAFIHGHVIVICW